MPNQTICRPAEQKDIDDLIELRKVLLNSSDEYYSANDETENRAWQTVYKNWLKCYLNDDRTRVNIYVLEKVASKGDSGIFGCAIGIIDIRAPMIGALSGKVGYIQSVVIGQSMRGRGLTKRLMNRLYDWFRVNDVEEVFLQSTPIALEVYKHMGFTIANEPYLIKQLND